MQADDVLACQFGRWYPGLAHLAYRSRVLDLPPGFGAWLQQDGVLVAEGSPAVRLRLQPAPDQSAHAVHHACSRCQGAPGGAQTTARPGAAAARTVVTMSTAQQMHRCAEAS